MTEFLVIGGGISGLLCATLLQRAGLRVRVVDKGRGFGGRLATRDTGACRIDHGAQYITVRDPVFRRWMEEWVDAGVACEWFRNSDGRHPRYRGSRGISGIAAHLAGPLELLRSTRIVSLARNGGRWLAEAADGTSLDADGLVLTLPMPQLLPLLATSGHRLPPELGKRFAAVRYERVIAGLVELDGPSGLPVPGGLKVGGSADLEWIADNRVKGISPGRTALTLHSTPAFAEACWEQPDEQRIPRLIEAAGRWIGGAAVASWSGHRWGFARPVRTAGMPCHADPVAGLALDDSFGGERVESAALSGIAAAREILSSFPVRPL